MWCRPMNSAARPSIAAPCSSRLATAARLVSGVVQPSQTVLAWKSRSRWSGRCCGCAPRRLHAMVLEWRSDDRCIPQRTVQPEAGGKECRAGPHMETTADQSATAADCEARLLEADQSVAVHGASVSDSRSRRRHSLRGCLPRRLVGISRASAISRGAPTSYEWWT